MKKVNLCLLFVIATSCLCAQHDSTYFTRYTDKLSIGLFSSLRNYNIVINSDFSKAAALPSIDYATNARSQWGVALSYDKLRVGIAIGKKPYDNTYGKSNTKNLALEIGGNAFYISVGYRNYTGMYDKNSTHYIPDSLANLYIDPSMKISTYRLKGMYFFNNKKYSFGAAYLANQRQLKSAASFLVTSNIHHERIGTEATLIPQPLAAYYGGDAMLKNIKWWGNNIGIGATGNLVFLKRWFLHGTVTIGTETQWRQYLYTSGYNKNICKISLAGDFKAGIGYNANNFFASFSSSIDYHTINTSNLTMVESLTTGYIIIGYRFGVKEPRLYKKFRTTKLYQKL